MDQGIVSGIWSVGGYILEELGITASLLDSLELSIGLGMLLVELFFLFLSPWR